MGRLKTKANMKSNRYITLAVLSVFLLGTPACREEFFDEFPQDTFNEASFYKKASDFELGLNAAYGSLRNSYRNWYAFGDVYSDDAYNWKFNNSQPLITINEANTASDNSLVSSLWSGCYGTIALANLIIDRSAVVSYDETRKKRYVAEARFLRGLMYFNLVRVFGNVPLVVREIVDPQTSFDYGREPVDKVYEQILSDLRAAEQDLPASYTLNADVGRATSR